MTLFRKVFSQETDDDPTPIRTSYDVASISNPEDLVEMKELETLLSTATTKDTEQLPQEEAVAEAQAMIAAAQSAQPNNALETKTQTTGQRAKTRLLGFNTQADEAFDPLNPSDEAVASFPKFPVGWLVIVDGAGCGTQFALVAGVTQIGRSEDQGICLDFGDTAISRENHAAIAFDPEQSKFFLGHGGKSNIVRRNDQPVLATEELCHKDTIRIGETTLRFVALCDATFRWDA